jgi:hypothetical protein
MRFHSKKRSQSAVSEPTRLSVPLRGDQQGVEPEKLRDRSADVCSSVRLSSNAARAGTPGAFSSTTTQRQTVDESRRDRADTCRACRSTLNWLAEQKVVMCQDVPNR